MPAPNEGLGNFELSLFSFIIESHTALHSQDAYHIIMYMFIILYEVVTEYLIIQGCI